MTVYSASHVRLVLAALAGLSACAFSPLSAQADQGDYPYVGQSHCLVRGIIRRVDPESDHLTLVGDDDHVYRVDTYDASIILADATRNADTRDLERGMHVRMTGTLVSSDLIEAATVREIAGADVPPAPRQPSGLEVLPNGRASLLGVVRAVDPDLIHITVADADGTREVVDTLDAAITLPGGRADGQAADLARGMRVQITGTRLAHARMVADQVRVMPDIIDPVPPAPEPAALLAAVAPAPLPLPVLPRADVSVPGLVPPSPDPQLVLAHLDSYTGILIDTRHLSTMSRSPAPSIFGPEPGESLLYPDRSHVPTPDEVQTESVVRYYRTMADAHAGVCGDNPLILPAQAVLTPAQDSVRLSASDMVLFNALEQKLHFTRTWKVGFLLAGDK